MEGYFREKKTYIHIRVYCVYTDVHKEPIDRYSSNPTQFISQRRRRKKLFSTKSTIMNTQMGNSLPSEKLDRNNFASWEYKMH